MANKNETKTCRVVLVSPLSQLKDALCQKVKETVYGALNIRKCTKCGSKNITEVTGLGDPLRMKQTYKCNDCGETFTLRPFVVQ